VDTVVLTASRGTSYSAAVNKYLRAIDRGDFSEAISIVGDATEDLDDSTRGRLARFCLLVARECLESMSAWYEADGISTEAALVAAKAELPRNAHDQSIQSAHAAIDCLLLLSRREDRKAEEFLKHHTPEELGEILLALATLTLEHSHALERQRAKNAVSLSFSRVRDRAIEDLQRQLAKLSIEVSELRKRLSNGTQSRKALRIRPSSVARRPAAKKAAKRK
jgi:hypothetical protein